MYYSLNFKLEKKKNGKITMIILASHMSPFRNLSEKSVLAVKHYLKRVHINIDIKAKFLFKFMNFDKVVR